MSLDVHLITPGKSREVPAKIFIRREGATIEVSVEEWAETFPDRAPVVVSERQTEEVFAANITHNLNHMALEAGLYECLWRPDEHGITKASQLIEPLRRGLELLKSDPVRFSAFNKKNGWGTYEQFVPWVERYLNACEQNPEAKVGVSR